MAERASTAKTILSNVGWLVAAEVAGRLVTFIALMHLTRALGPAPLGIVEFGLAVFALLSLVSLGGVEILAKRQVARTTRGIGRVAGTSLVLSWTWLGVAVALLALFAPLVERPAPTFLVATGFIVAAALTPLGLRFAFLGRERMDRLAIASVAGQLVWAASVLVFVESTDDVLLVPALWLAGEATRVILLMVAYKGLFGRIRMPRARGLRVWAAASVPVSLGRIARGSLYLIDVFILGLIGVTTFSIVSMREYESTCESPAWLAMSWFVRACIHLHRDAHCRGHAGTLHACTHFVGQPVHSLNKYKRTNVQLYLPRALV